MDRCIWFIVISALVAVSHVNGFLFTPKFRLFLNQMRETQPNHEFIKRWDFGDRQATNHYTPNKGMFESSYSLIFLKELQVKWIRNIFKQLTHKTTNAKVGKLAKEGNIKF